MASTVNPYPAITIENANAKVNPEFEKDPLVLSLEVDERFALQNRYRVLLVAKLGGKSSTILAFDKDGSLQLAVNIDKALGLPLDENGSLVISGEKPTS